MALYQDFPQGVLTPGFLDGIGQTQGAPVSPDLMGQGALALPGLDMGQMAAGPEVKGKRPGLFGRIRQQPGGSRALIALGASLLSNPNFFEGLGQGALAYQNTLDEEQRRRQPQLTKDANFTYTVDPETGEVVFKRTAAADFEEAQNQAKLQASLAGIGIREEGDTKRLATTLGYKDTWNERDNQTQRYGIDQRREANELDNKTDLEIARINGENAFREAQMRQGLNGDKPPPAAVQKQIGDYTATRDAQANAASTLEPIIGAIERGDLSFSLPNNLRHKAAIATGIGGNQETVWFSQYQTSLESLRNALLVANKGVQTDGDAERAMAELIAGSGNTQTVLANLKKVYAALGTRGQQAQARIDELARQYGADVGNSSPGSGAPRAAPKAPRRSTGTANGVRWRIVN